MHLSRVRQFVGFALTTFVLCSPQYSNAQVAPSAQSAATPILPYATVSFGPTPLDSRNYDHGGMHPGIDVSLGARKRMSGVFGVVASLNAGKMFDTVLGGEDALCRIRQDGKPGCYNNSPLSSWFGASVGAEAYVGRTILGLQVGPTAVSAEKDERLLVAGAPNREWGVRMQVDANFVVVRNVGINLSAANRYVPKILNDRWHVLSLTAGLTLGDFRGAIRR